MGFELQQQIPEVLYAHFIFFKLFFLLKLAYRIKVLSKKSLVVNYFSDENI